MEDEAKIAINGEADAVKDVDDDADGQMVEEQGEEREKWDKKVEFFLSAIGYAVGLGNVWRFPYLCFKNGGGAFLIPYLIMLFLCGMPLFFMELSLGQYLSLGPVTSWAAICPIAKGIGFSMLVVSFLCCVYYNVIIAWCLYYLFESFGSEVPWKDCQNEWNTPRCRVSKTDKGPADDSKIGLINGTLANSTLCQNGTALANSTVALANSMVANSTVSNCSLSSNATVDATAAAVFESTTPSQEFWENYVLDMTPDMESTGSIRWPLFLALVLAWILVYFCLWKGIKSSGKVVYFTATFPYVVLIILFFRGITLPGAGKGIEFYLKPDFKKLAEAKVWVAAATQIFYSLGIGFGSLITYGSYNKFHNNCFRDAMVVSIINCSTSVFAGLVIFSVLGFMADVLGKEVQDVATSGPGLAFVVYPEGIAQMPISPFWAVCFFFMLLTLGLDTQFAMFEAVVAGLVDEYPAWLKKRRELFIALLCFCCFLLGIPMVTQAGAYILNLYDWQSGGVSLLFLAFFEAITLSWGYGADRFAEDIRVMTGNKIGRWWPFAWKYCSPLVILGIFIFSLIQWNGISYGKYPYPGWAEFCGWILAMASMLWIPGVAIYTVIRAPGDTWRERLRYATTPDPRIIKAVELREGIPARVELISI